MKQTLLLAFITDSCIIGCTKQACAFAQSYEEFKKQNIAVIGISKDSVSAHKKFVEKYDLPFLLLSDPELKDWLLSLIHV